MSSSSLSASSSSNKTSHGNGGHSPCNDKGSMADNARNGIGEELTRMDDRHQLSSTVPHMMRTQGTHKKVHHLVRMMKSLVPLFAII
jgi:hypothetical protein